MNMTAAQKVISVDPGLTLELGDHSYIHDNRIRNPSGALTRVRIGKFCSIATDLTVIGYDHHTEWLTMFPFLDDGHRVNWPGTEGIPYPQAAEFGSNKSRGDIVIGNDVWLGYAVKLFKGVTIGDGAVVGACSLVTKSVEPYTIVAGTPARPLRKRFTNEQIVFLQKIRWWDWPREMINRYMRFLCGSQFAEFEQALAQDPEYQRLENISRADESLALADAAYARNDLKAACTALRQALSFVPDSVSTLVCLGNIQFQLESFDEARRSFSRAAELKPDDADIQVRLANAASRCQDLELVDQALQRALKLNPANPDALRLAVLRHLELGRYAEGAESCCTLLCSSCDDVLSLLELGKCLRELKDFASARWCYERALELDRANTIAQTALAALNGQPVQCSTQRLQPEPCLE